MKTAMQELIEASETYNTHDFAEWVNSNKESLLRNEKKQIIDAAKHGANFDKSPYKNPEDYYNETFGEL